MLFATGGQWRQPKDIDLIAEESELADVERRYGVRNWIPSTDGHKLVGFAASVKLPIEVELAFPATTAAQLVQGTVEHLRMASLDTCYLLKMSHRFLRHSKHFEKTRRDILVMEAMGASIPDAALLKARERETYNYPHPNLNTTKGAFFNPDQVPYTYDHDSIHEAIAWPMPPAYKSYQDAAVNCSRVMFEALPYRERLRGVLEEAYVLALERSQIPFGVLSTSHNPVPPLHSFTMALQRVCTSIASGWWREFAWRNYDTAMVCYNAHYTQKFSDGLARGIVKPFAR